MAKYKLILVGAMLVSVSALAQQTRSTLVYSKGAAFGYDVRLTNNGNVRPPDLGEFWMSRFRRSV